MWLRNVYVKKGQEEEVQMWQAKDLGIFCIFQGAVTQALKVLL